MKRRRSLAICGGASPFIKQTGLCSSFRRAVRFIQTKGVMTVRGFIKFAKAIAKGARFLVMVGVVLIMLLTVADILMRWIFSSPILGVMEYSQMLMAVILLAAASTAMNDAHIQIDIVTSKLPNWLQVAFRMFTQVLSFVVTLLIGTRATVEAVQAFNEHLTFSSLSVMKAPFYLLYALGMYAMCIAIVALFFEAILKLRDMNKDGEKKEETV